MASGGGTIHACANKTSGALRVARHCKRNERVLSWNAVGPQGPKGNPGSPGASGSTGASGTTGAPGAPGTARAYGVVDHTGAIIAAHSKNVVSVASTSPGLWCITLAAGIDPSTSAPVASVDFNDSATGLDAGVEVRSDAQSDCGSATQLEIITYTQQVVSGAISNTFAPHGFTFIVP
jgi:hypothetical protein